MHDADVTKGRCSRIDSPPRSYYADVIWPANTLPGPIPIRLAATAILLPSISTSLFFSAINPVFVVAPSINTELISKMSIALYTTAPFTQT